MKGSIRLPVSAQDTFNYLARYFFSNYQIQCVLRLDGRIDQSILAEAIRLIGEAEPVLTSRFVEGEERCFWERIEKIDTDEACAVIETENVEEHIQKYLMEELPAGEEPQVRMRCVTCPELFIREWHVKRKKLSRKRSGESLKR